MAGKHPSYNRLDQEPVTGQRTLELFTQGYWLAVAAAFSTIVLLHATIAAAGKLSAEDFKFDGPLGSQGATIEEMGENHFRISRLKNDPRKLVEPLKTRGRPKGAKTTWNEGPHVQFGIRNVLCEGSGDWTSKDDCLEAGAVLMKSIAKHYRGTKP